MDDYLKQMIHEQKQLDEELRNSRFYRKVRTNVKKEINRYKPDGSKVEVTLNKKEYYSQEDIAAFNLESYSKLIPDHDGYKTIVSTYFIRFWGPVFDYKEKKAGNKRIRRSSGMIAYTYIVLKSYCWGKDYTWISLQTLADNLSVSKNSVRTYLEELEKEGFIIRFWRESDIDGNIEDESMLIKVRQTIPFLTKEKLDLLPKNLKKEHDKFLRFIRLESIQEFEDAYRYTEVYENLREKVIEVKDPAEEISRPYDEIVKELTEDDRFYWKSIKLRLKDYISQDSIDYWFNKGACQLKEHTLVIYVRSQFEQEHIKKHFLPILYDVSKDLLIPADQIEIKTHEG